MVLTPFLPMTGFETFGVSRKFQTGKKAKKVALATTEMREAYEESMKNSEESQRTQAILEEFKEKRGASLMDRHVAKKADQPKAAPSGRRAFDRELVCYRSYMHRCYRSLYLYLVLVVCQKCHRYVLPQLHPYPIIWGSGIMEMSRWWQTWG